MRWRRCRLGSWQRVGPEVAVVAVIGGSSSPTPLPTISTYSAAPGLRGSTVSTRIRESGQRASTAFAAGITASLLASPVVWSHYLVLVLAVLLVIDLPRRWIIVAALASWAIAPPHGHPLDTDLIEGIASSLTWPIVVVLSLLVLSVASRRTRKRLPPSRGSAMGRVTNPP